MLNILVCVKQVPDINLVKMDPVTGSLIRAGVPAILNPLDANALEAAVRVKEAHGGTVTVITMGPDMAKEALRECLAAGADRAVLLSDRAFANADTLATSYVIASAAKQLGDFDLIFCGKESLDGATGQMGSQLAERFGGDFDLVVCHGGDGTLNETVNGIMRLPQEKRPPLSYLPGGSTNDFAASLSISSDPALAAQSAMRLQPRDLDVGVFNEKNFVYVASFGAFTRTAYTVPQDIKNMFGHFAYLLEGVKDLETLCPYPMKITADGEVFEGEYLFGAVCNSTSIAGLMKLSPDAVDLCDGQFELMLVPVPKTPLQLQRTIRAIVYEEYETSNALIFRHVRHVTAESDGSIPWTLDGEYAPGVPKIEIGIEDNGIQMMI